MQKDINDIMHFGLEVLHFAGPRYHLPACLGKVKAGEEIAVTSLGKIIARLVPEVDVCSAA